MYISDDDSSFEIVLDDDEIDYLLSSIKYMFPDLYDFLCEMIQEVKNKVKS